MNDKYKITEIFYSVQGEGINTGMPAVFIRFAGCNLRCKWNGGVCDTQQDLEAKQGEHVSIESIVGRIRKIGCKKITITGGEPLVQQDALLDLVYRLDEDYQITVETNGSFLIDPELARKENVSLVVDYKLPSSQMESRMKMEVFYELNVGDFVKFVIADRKDYLQAVKIMHAIRQHDFGDSQFAFSPCVGSLDPTRLYKWLVKDKEFNIILNVQLHKLINLP